MIESRIQGHYILADSWFSSRCQFQVFRSGQIPILSTQLTLSNCLEAPKRQWLKICCKFRWKRTVSIKHIGSWAWQDQPIDQIGLIRPSVYPSKSQIGGLQVIWSLGCHAKYGSTTSIPSLNITSNHPRPTDGFVGFFYPYE